MMEYAWIEENHLWDQGKGELAFTHRWVGKGSLAKIHPPLSDMLSGRASFPAGDKFTMGELNLRVVDQDGIHWIVALDSWYAPAYKVLHRIIKSLDMMKFCLIIVLSIWGLADYNPGALPSWRDIKCFKKQ